MRKFIKVLLSTLGVVLLLISAYALWSLIAYRDIATADLLDEYGQGAQVVEIAGTPVAYRIDGDVSQGAPWVLVHSHYFDSLMWDEILKHLSPQHGVIRYDLTSHGLTGPDSQADYSMGRDLELLHGLLTHLKVTSAVVVGSSLGGNIAFHYAAKFPQQTAGLVLINSGGIKRQQTSRRNAASIPDWFYRVFYFVPTAAFQKFITWMVVDEADVSEALLQRFHAMFRHQGNRKAEMQRMSSFDAGQAEAVLAAVTAPTLILWGRENPQLPVELVAEFERLMIGADSLQSVIIDGAGHLLPVEKPAQTAAAMNTFRGRL
ncbi:MAG: pimeloyl-ACP methyl ester carboxylesterase [Zhongshania sp.]